MCKKEYYEIGYSASDIKLLDRAADKSHTSFRPAISMLRNP